MYSLIRPFLFRMDPEHAHYAALAGLKWLPKFFFKQPLQLPVDAMGMQFKHPVGLAAGLDKNGEYLDGLAKLGFSFIEVGSITPRAQSGNPKPRLFRLPEAQAIINCMGFNNIGVEGLISNLQRTKYRGILGINIGKNRDTSLNDAANDYLYCLKKVYPYASYVTINVSSPNTPDLRLLQQEVFLQNLLSKLIEQQKRLADEHQRFVPLLIKVSPDESDEDLKKMTDIIVSSGISGIIATNTTCSRYGVENIPQSKEQGGLSGAPLLERSTVCLRLIRQLAGNELTLIGVGGIDSPQAAREKIEAGASLIQIYSGLIYQGQKLISNIVSKLKTKHQG